MSEQKDQGRQPGRNQQPPQQTPKPGQQKPKSEKDPQFDDEKLSESGGTLGT